MDTPRSNAAQKKMLNHNSPIPLYHQLSDILENRIRNGEYEPGHRIPSEPQLAQTFGIGRPTVRQAIEVLVRKGVLRKRKGSGTFVCESAVEINLFSMAGTTSAFFEKGKSIETRIIEPTSLIDIEPRRENPFSGSQAYFFSRLTIVDRAPVLFEDIFMRAELFPDFDQVEIERRSLEKIVKNMYYMESKGFRQNFTVVQLEADKANWLDLKPGSPVLQVNRYIHFQHGTDAIYSRIYCRTDKFVFSQVLEGNIYD